MATTGHHRLGIDLGGTKIEAVVLDTTGRALARRRTSTPKADYEATLVTTVALVRDIEADLGVRCTVGVGAPGALSAMTGRLKNSNSTCLNDRPLLSDLAGRLERPVRLANDADCFALSEATDGAGAGAPTVFGVILGTGVGGGIVVNGRLLAGANAIAGEWGHNPLPTPRAEDLPLPRCYCGREGCIETYLSGPGMARDHAAATGSALTPPQIAERAALGDGACEATLRRYEQRLARALATVINVLDPHVIVLGGGLSNLERLYDNVPRLWGPHVFSDSVVTRLVRNVHGDSSGVRGAAWLWDVQEEQSPLLR